MPAKHKNTVYKPVDIPNPFTEGQDKAFGEILLHSINENKKWRNLSLSHYGCLFLYIILFIITMCQQQVVPVLVNVMPTGEAQYLGEVRQTGSIQIPEQAIHYQIRLFISNLRSVSTDYMVVYKNIDDVFFMVTDSYVPILRNVIRDDSPFEYVGKIRRTVDIESILLVTGRSYQVNWSETVYESSTSQSVTRHRAVVTILLATPNPQSMSRNPLGIYIENMEMTQL